MDIQALEPTSDCTGSIRLGPRNTKTLLELVVEQPSPRLVRLEPLAIDDQLRNGSLADVPNQFI